MGQVASEMDALSLAILYPRRAATLPDRPQAACRRQPSRSCARCARKSNSTFEHHKISAVLRDRWRPFSIAAAKSMGRGLPALYTLEIQVDRTMDAYLALGLLHSLYPPIPGKLRDHLHVPSQFGYQALKTTVQAGENRMRVEITTRKLARFNESGVLAPGFEFRQANFRELMRSLLEGESAFDTESLRLASASIQVYTPARGNPDPARGEQRPRFRLRYSRGIGPARRPGPDQRPDPVAQVPAYGRRSGRHRAGSDAGGPSQVAGMGGHAPGPQPHPPLSAQPGQGRDHPMSFCESIIV